MNVLLPRLTLGLPFNIDIYERLHGILGLMFLLVYRLYWDGLPFVHVSLVAVEIVHVLCGELV